jgi:hypothetical protein
VIVLDWPGVVGRSAAFPSDAVNGDVVAEALGALLDHLGTAVGLQVRSVSGPYGFQVGEQLGEVMRALVAVVSDPQGNIQPAPPALRKTESRSRSPTCR